MQEKNFLPSPGKREKNQTASLGDATQLLSDRSFNIIMLVLIGLGAILRLREFVNGRSLWLDEAMLAINILERSFLGLTQQPMEYGQSAPIGFVIVVKFFSLFLGDSEYALRLYSLLVGLAASLLMVWLANKLLGRVGALLAVTFFSFSPFLIYYSAELKQYMGDVAGGLVLLFLFIRHIEKPVVAVNWKDHLLLGLSGAVLLWFSHPVLFVAAGIGTLLFVHALMTQDKRLITQTIGLLALWGISFGTLYLINLRHLTSSDLLLDFWADGFMPLPPWSPGGGNGSGEFGLPCWIIRSRSKPIHGWCLHSL
ncbi:MAG: hypothetical protein Kow002_21580 [Anaerolineales bacterium]